MTDSGHPSEFLRYLRLLGVQQSEPTAKLLREVVRAQMTRVPFENISKLYYLKTLGLRGIPSFEQYLDGIEQYRFGGTCYANNYYLYLLLRFLGFDVDLCGADMKNPDVHVVSIVRVGGREFLVDAGYGAPFLDPLPRDKSSDYTVTSEPDRYILRPQDAEGRSRLEFQRNRKPMHGYLAKPQPRRIEEFKDAILDSFRPDATFMNTVLIVKFTSTASSVLRGMTYTENQDDQSKSRCLESREELLEAIHQGFGMPSEFARVALDGLTLSQDAWG